MIRLLDDALKEWLQSEVPFLQQQNIKIDFATPDNTWSAGRTEPTLNVFLWDIRRSVHEARTGRVAGRGDDGIRLAPPRIAFRYHLTAWSREPVDEHDILGAVLTFLLGRRTIEPPERYLRGQLATARPYPDLRVATPDNEDFVDFWSAIEGKLKAGIDLVVTATVDTNDVVARGVPIGGRSVGSRDRRQPERTSGVTSRGGRVYDDAAIGATVQTQHGASVVGSDGTFWVPAEPGDTLTVHTEPPASVTVPPIGPVVVGEPDEQG